MLPNEPSPAEPTFPFPPMAGQWKFVAPKTKDGPDELIVDVRQQPDRVDLFLLGPRPNWDGITLYLRPADQLIDGKVIGKGGVLGNIVVKMLKGGTRNSWEAKVHNLRDNKEEAIFGKGDVSSDWRHWEGGITGAKGENIVVTMDLLEEDTMFVWASRRGATEEKLTFLKRK